MALNFPQLNARIDELARSASATAPQHAEQILFEIIGPLLEHQGYAVRSPESSVDRGIDVSAVRVADERFAATKLGFEFKHYRSGRPASVEAVQQLLGAAVWNGIDRAILVSTSGFTESARRELARDLPVAVELLSLDDLKAWVHHESDRSEEHAENYIAALIRDVSSQLAELIARQPEAVAYIEWRDVERVVAEVFQGIGFGVTLTPASKDGGKDVILECHVEGVRKTFIVEIKHWRSGKRVGSSAITDFVQVVAHEKRDGGLFLSSYGFAADACSALSELERKRVRLGAREKIVALCRTYSRSRAGIWSPPPLGDLLFDGTI